MPIEIVNTLPPPWPEGVLVSVFNDNQEESILRFDGKDWAFPAQNFESIPPEAAFFLFGIETRLAERLGQAMAFSPEARRECVIRYGALSDKGSKWFNAFRFKLVKLGKKGSRESWTKLMALSEL